VLYRTDLNPQAWLSSLGWTNERLALPWSTERNSRKFN